MHKMLLGKSDLGPFVSVVMPVFNEGDFIERSLTALIRQTYEPTRMEIIVADGVSTDDTWSKIMAIIPTSPLKIRIISNPKRIAPAGLNLAIIAAQGDIVIRVDGHCEVDRHYVANCVKHLQNGRAECVGGPIETLGESRQARAIAAAMSSSFGVGGSAFRTIDDREIYVDTVAFPGYTKETLIKTGPFNEELVRNQDDEFNYRIREMGGRILLSPDIRSRYFSRSSFRSLWRQYYQYGYWKVRVFQLHPRQMSLRQFVPAAFITSIVFFSFLSLFLEPARWGLVTIVTAYAIAAAVSAVKASTREDALSIPSVFLSFIILHTSYGLGFLTGLCSFWRRWHTPGRRSPQVNLEVGPANKGAD